MADVIRMPEVLAGATEAAIQTWLIAPGSVVTLGQPLAEIETEKAVVELNAESAGAVGRLLAAEGESVAVGDAILVLLADGEGEGDIGPALQAAGMGDADAGAAAPEPETAAERETSPADVPAAAPEADLAGADVPAPASGGRRFASPLVRRLARTAGVDLAVIPGTGPQGRVVRRDLERYLERQADTTSPEAAPPPLSEPVPASVSSASPAAATPAAATPAAATPAAAAGPAPAAASVPGAPYEDVPLDRMRKAIARRLTESKSTVPHFYLVADCRVDELLKLRAAVNASAPRKISVNDFVLKAVAAALAEVPAANAVWNGDSIRRFSSVDLAVAVATEGGLSTPVLRSVERMSLGAVSETVAELAERARAGRLRQHELDGGSFSVSNLGMYGTTQFTAILNPPQSGILAAGAARKVPVVGSDGELAVASVMTVTLSADHRVLDGAVAAQWLAAFQRRIENPLSILI